MTKLERLEALEFAKSYLDDEVADLSALYCELAAKVSALQATVEAIRQQCAPEVENAKVTVTLEELSEALERASTKGVLPAVDWADCSAVNPCRICAYPGRITDFEVSEFSGVLYNKAKRGQTL